jgi:hypothetical protein
MMVALIMSLRHLLGWAVSAFSSRENLILENLALRQQILGLHAKRPRRRLRALHKLFWVVLRRLWSDGKGCGSSKRHALVRTFFRVGCQPNDS